MIKSDLVQLASKYNKLFAEYPKTKNILNDARKDLLSNKNTTESTVKCIKCIVCDLTLKTDSGLKVHTDLTHRNVSGNQGNVEYSHFPEKFSDLTLMKKHNKRKHRVPCKQFPKTLKEKLPLSRRVAGRPRPLVPTRPHMAREYREELRRKRRRPATGHDHGHLPAAAKEHPAAIRVRGKSHDFEEVEGLPRRGPKEDDGKERLRAHLLTRARAQPGRIARGNP